MMQFKKVQRKNDSSPILWIGVISIVVFAWVILPIAISLETPPPISPSAEQFKGLKFVYRIDKNTSNGIVEDLAVFVYSDHVKVYKCFDYEYNLTREDSPQYAQYTIQDLEYYLIYRNRRTSTYDSYFQEKHNLLILN